MQSALARQRRCSAWEMQGLSAMARGGLTVAVQRSRLIGLARQTSAKRVKF